MASGSAGHWPTHDRVSSSASHAGLEARIAAIADASPSRRNSCAEYRAASAAGALAGEPVHAGSAASTATACDGWASAHDVATAAPIDTPPTAIGPRLAALSNSRRYPSMSASGSGAGVTTVAPTSCSAAEKAR